MAATEKVGIEVEILGLDEARKEMESFEHDLKSLNGFKVRIDAQNRLGELRKEAAALRSEMARLKTEQDKTTRGSEEWKKFANDMNNIRAKMAAVNAEIGRIRTGLNSVKSLRTVFNQISSSVAHMGSAMQSAGNAISRLMTPLRMLGTGALLGAGFKAMNTVSEGLSAGFERYDIMHKYPRMMKQFETANYSAEKSVKDLEQSVLGLPTGLDEMVNLSQRFTMTIGDMKKGTDLAIATNNAFLASMSTDTQKYQGMMQLQDVLGGKKLNAREWQSLANSMMPAIRMMGEDLGKSGKELKEWVSNVQQGKISNEEFIKALKKTGTGMGKAAQMAEQSKDTWEAFASNTRIAFSRLTVGVIESMDEIVKVATGGKTKSLNMLLTETLIPGINNLSESVKGWIKAHPKEITDFFRDLKSIDWAGLAKGFAEGIGSFAKLAQGIAKSLSGKDLSKIGRIIFDLNVLGNGLLIVGGLFKGLRGVIATIGTVGAGLGRALGAAGFAGATSKLTGLLKFFKGFGKVGKAASTASKAAGIAGGAAGFGSIFSAFLPALEVLGGVGALLTGATGIAALDTTLLSVAVDNVVKITDGMSKIFRNVKGLKGQDFDGTALKDAVGSIMQMWDIFSGQDEVIDAHGIKKDTGRGFNEMDKTMLKDISDSMVSMSSIIGSMSQMQVNLKGLKGFKGFNEKITEGVRNFATALGGIYSAFEEAFGGEGAFNKGAINPEQAQGFADIITSTETMFASLGKIVNKIPKVLTGLTNLVKTPGGMGESPVASLKKMLIGEDTTGGLFKDIHDIFQKLKDDFQNIDTGVISDKMGQVVTAIQSIRKIGNQLTKMGSAGTLNSEGIDTAISNIKSFISKLSTALDTTVVGDIQNKVGALRTTINGIFQALNTDLSNVEVTVNIKGEVKGADDLVSKINKAHTQITNAVRKIPSTITKTVTVNINGKVNNNLPSIPNLDHPPHTGGYITGKHSRPLYRAKGGIINPFRPKGTDTVPTVLTPGEYVMKRSAVDAFGVRFMQRINNMDIRGAMRELSSKAGRIASVNRGTTNYITNNNNQQVTQHINTSNPNFAYKRSNRYVMAL